MKLLTKIEPLITETTIALTKSNWYTFKLPVDLNKNQIRALVEELFKVNVLDIKTIQVKGKTKRSLKNRKLTTASNWKKAMVRIKEGQKIEIFDIAGN